MRKLALTLVPLVLLQASGAYALGVGDIELHSALNQPLNAEIRLLSATPAELQGLTVALAPEAAFAGAGVERLGLLTQIKFNVVQKSDGSHVIKVTSSQPIREPFLNFLVEVNWSSGRFMREYTVLLDFPVSDGGKPAPIAPPVSAPFPPVTPRVEAAPAAQSEPSVSSSTDNSMAGNGARKAATRERSSAAGSSYGPTARTDTLWKIAREMRPDKSVSVSQVMLALAKSNPHAFSTGNVNNLMAGYILRLPPADAIRAVPQQEAAHEVAMQYQQWLGAQKGGAATARATPTQGVESTAPVTEKGSAGAQLKLVTPDGGKTAVTAGGGAKTGAPDANDLTSLRKELAVALESVDTTRQENEELRTRLTMLEQQISSMQRLMNLKNGDLATLQNKANTATATGTAPAKPAVPAPGTAASSKPDVKPQPVKAPEPEQPIATDAISEIASNPQQLGMILGGFLLVSALLWTLVRRRRQAAMDAPEGAFAPQGRDAFASKAKKTAASAAAFEGVGEGDRTAPEADMGRGDENVIHADEDVIDPLAEADVYLAYRRYDQAESLIKEAMREDPGRQELTLKLLEIYHATKNADAFETQAETLYARLGGEADPLWHKVVEMGKQVCPGHPLFGGSSSDEETPGETPYGVVLAGAVGVGAAAIAAADAFHSEQNIPTSQGMDDFTLPGMQAEESHDGSAVSAMDFSEMDIPVVQEAAQSAIADNSIDFDFGFSEQGGTEVSPVQLAAEMEEHLSSGAVEDSGLDNSLDFDLSLSGAINNLSQEVNINPVVADAQEVAENVPGVYLLDEQDMSGSNNTFSSMALDESLDAELESIQLAALEEPASTLENVSKFAFDLEDSTSASHDFGLLAQETSEAADAIVSKAPSNEWDLDAALSAFDGTAPDEVPAQETDDDLFAGIDMVGTKLDLAKAYIDMEDQEGAKVLLDEVLDEGNDEQKQEAQELMRKIV